MLLKLKAVEETIPPTARMASTGVLGDLCLHCFAVDVTEDEEEEQGKPKQKKMGTKHNDTVGKKMDMAKKKGKKGKKMGKVKEEKQKQDKQDKEQRNGSGPKA